MNNKMLGPKPSIIGLCGPSAIPTLVLQVYNSYPVLLGHSEASACSPDLSLVCMIEFGTSEFWEM